PAFRSEFDLATREPGQDRRQTAGRTSRKTVVTRWTRRVRRSRMSASSLSPTQSEVSFGRVSDSAPARRYLDRLLNVLAADGGMHLLWVGFHWDSMIVKRPVVRRPQESTRCLFRVFLAASASRGSDLGYSGLTPESINHGTKRLAAGLERLIRRIVCKIREIGPGSHKISFGNQALHVG